MKATIPKIGSELRKRHYIYIFRLIEITIIVGFHVRKQFHVCNIKRGL